MLKTGPELDDATIRARHECRGHRDPAFGFAYHVLLRCRPSGGGCAG